MPDRLHDYMKIFWVLLAFAPALLAYLNGAFFDSAWFWWITGTCCLLACSMIMKGSTEKKTDYVAAVILAGICFFFANAVVVVPVGCSRPSKHPGIFSQ
jgi:hypothetical protein